MRRVVVTYLVETPNKTDKGEQILTGIWATDGKNAINNGKYIQIFDANTGEVLNGVVEVKISVSGPHGINGTIKSLVMTKNPEAGKDITKPDGTIMKAPAFIPVMDNRKNVAMTEEECLVVELAPMSDELYKKLQSIREVPSKLAQELKDKMAAAGEAADLTKEESK